MDIFKEIHKLNFPPKTYIVVGSGSLAVLGIKDLHDIDLVVLPELFEKCKAAGWEQIPWTYQEKLGQVFLRKNFVELYLDVNSGEVAPTFAELVSRAFEVNGVLFISLNDVLKFKKAYGKMNPKHLVDIVSIEKYLANKLPVNIKNEYI